MKPSDITWVRGGIDDPTRPEKITIKLPPDVTMVDAPEGKTISQLLESGDIDAFIAPRVPRLAGKKNPNIGWLFPDPIAAGKDYFKRTGIFPIMHVTGIRRTLVEQHPWLPAAVFKALEQSKAKCMEETGGHRHHQVHAAVPRRAAARRARTHGARFLVLRAARQPQGAGDVPASPPFGEPVAAAGDAGGDVSSLDARGVHDLTDFVSRTSDGRKRVHARLRRAMAVEQSRDPDFELLQSKLGSRVCSAPLRAALRPGHESCRYFFAAVSVPRSMAAVATAE